MFAESLRRSSILCARFQTLVAASPAGRLTDFVMHAALLFPPATDPRSPHLALPSLAAALRASGVRTTLRDLDLEGFRYFTHPTRVADAIVGCERQLAGPLEERQRTRAQQALTHADYVMQTIGDAQDRLRRAETFYDPHALYTARECLHRALVLVSTAAGAIDYGIGSARYNVEGYDPSSLSDLARVTSDPSANLFAQLWDEQLLPALDRDRPDLVGVSILNFQQIVPGLTLARLLKAQGHFVVIGGTVYSKFVPQLLRHPEFFELFCDGVVVYEGETALLALLEQLAGGRHFGAVPNFIHLDRSGQPVLARTHAENVDSLPTPDFDGLALDDYLAPAPVLPILTGKGCYFNRCKFCDIPFINKVAGKAYRVRAPERVAADVARLHERHGVRHFEITDEALAPRLLLQLADALGNHPRVDPRFVGYARLEPGFTPEVCRRIHDAGVRKLFFGLESGAQVLLDRMDKGIRVEVAQRVLRNCVDAGVGFHLFSIVGFPEETEDTARATLQFFLDNVAAIDHPRNSFDMHPFTLDLRTAYAEDAERYGVTIDRVDLDRHTFPISVVRWQNGRGLTESRVSELLAEFTSTLRAAMPTYRQYPALLWPGFEEYALLYGDHFEQRPFPYRFSLPTDGDPLAFCLVWADSVQMQEQGDHFIVRCLIGETIVDRTAILLLSQPHSPMCAAALLESLVMPFDVPAGLRAALRTSLRGAIDRLLGTGALELKPATSGPAA